MGDLGLFVIEAAVLAALVASYVRLRRRLAWISATTSSRPDPPEDHAVRLTGVLRAGRLSAMFVVVQIDRDAVWVRSRPRFLGLAVAVPRADVAGVTQPRASRGKAPNLVFEPAPDRAVGLGGLRLQLRGDASGLTRDLRRLGWSTPPAETGRGGRSRRPSDAKPRRGG